MQLRRRTLLGAGTAGLLGAAALTSCTPAPPPGEGLGEQPLVVPERALAELPELTPIPEVDRMPLETSGFVYQVLAARVLPALTAAQAEPFLGSLPEADVPAPEGRAFLVVQLQAEFAPWPFASLDPADAPVLRLRVRRPGAADPVALEVPDLAVDRPLLLQVAADAAPEDAVLEATTFGAVQRLSLIDGSRLPSEVEHLYGRRRTVDYSATALVRVLDAQRLAEDGSGDTLQLDIDQMQLTPATAAVGWPGPGQQLLGVKVTPWQGFVRGDGEGIALPARVDGRLDLPDGTAVPALRVDSTGAVRLYGQFSRESFVLWFPLPVDLDSATLHLDVQPFPRTADLAEGLGIQDGAQRALTFPADAAGS